MLSALKLGPGVMAPSRTNGFLNMLETMRKRTVMLTEQLPRFPSLSITASEIVPQGSFAEAQAQYLAPGADEVDALVKVCLLLLFIAHMLAATCMQLLICMHYSV